MKSIFSRKQSEDQSLAKYIMPGFFLIVLTLALLMLSLSRVRPTDFGGNLLSTDSPQENMNIEDNEEYLTLLQNMYAKVPGVEKFLADAATWQEIENVKIDNADSGIFVSVSATTTGDSLHPFFGYFRKEDGSVVEIVWAGVTTGALESEPETTQEKYMAASVVNTGKVPWLTGDIWKNDSNDEDLVLMANDEAEAIFPGESGTFVFRSTNARLVPHNMTRGFLINVEETGKN